MRKWLLSVTTEVEEVSDPLEGVAVEIADTVVEEEVDKINLKINLTLGGKDMLPTLLGTVARPIGFMLKVHGNVKHLQPAQ